MPAATMASCCRHESPSDGGMPSTQLSKYCCAKVTFLLSESCSTVLVTSVSRLEQKSWLSGEK